jgi:hypothetical protein
MGIVVSPASTFASVVATPKPAGILFLVALVMGLAQGVPQLTDRGRQAAIDMNVQMVERVQQFTGQPMTDEVYATIERRAAYGAYTAVAGSLIGLPIVTLFFGALYWVIFNAILGGTASFKQVLAVIAHSQVIAAIGLVLGAPIQYAQGAMSMSGPFNLGVVVGFLDPTSLVARVLGATSVFTVWSFLVTGIGLGVLYRRSGRNIGLALILVYVVIVAGVFTLFASFFSR